jgi:hypothetical protein
MTTSEKSPYHTPAKLVGLAALAGTILPPVAFLFGGVSLDVVKGIMLVAAILWFVAAPLWMKVD